MEHALELAAKVNVNSYGLVDPFDEGSNHVIGVGLFPAVGLCINHSCYPNSVYCFSADGSMEYRALRDLAPGEEVTVSYIDCSLPTMQRQEILRTQRFFMCRCIRCVRYEEALAVGAKEGKQTHTHTSRVLADLALSAVVCKDCGGEMF